MVEFMQDHSIGSPWILDYHWIYCLAAANFASIQALKKTHGWQH